MKVKLQILSVYCESVIQNTYTLTGYRAGVLLRYYQIQIYFVIIPMVTGDDEGTIMAMVIEPSPPLYHHPYHLWYYIF